MVLAIDGTLCAGGRVVVANGDITRLAVDAIVNAANSTLMGGGGVDGAIHRAGGPAILGECREIRASRYPDGLPTGQAVRTNAGRLPCRYVIHTVGPVWHGGTHDEDRHLVQAYEESLKLACEGALKSVAFPAISTGIFGFPKERAATLVMNALVDFLANHEMPQMVYLVFFSPADTERFLRSVSCP